MQTKPLNKEEVFSLCFDLFLLPFEGEGKVDSEGNFLAYLDPVGIPTIAWGMTFDEQGNKIKIGDVWSPERARKAKRLVLDTFLAGLLKASPSLAGASPRRIAAALSWIYNLGPSAYARSTFKVAIDNQDWKWAADECKRWNRAGGKVLRGLTRRREVEAEVLLKG